VGKTNNRQTGSRIFKHLYFGTFVNKIKVSKLTPNKVVEWECVESIDEWVGTTIVFELEDKDEKTLLRFTHGGWNEITDMFAGCTYD
jgi:hypothetical protein